MSTDLKLALAPQPTRDLLLRFGAEWQRFAFGVPSHAPVPPVLQKISATFGLEYQLTDKWLVRAQIQPGIYSDLQDVNWRDVDAPLLVGAAYLVNADLQWFFGVYIDPRSRYPALPAPGVRWRFADRWTLNLLYPNPRLEWDLTDKLKPYLSIGMELGTFTVGDHFGDDRGRRDLNRAPLDYSEFRVGPGFSWKIWRQFTIDAEAGYMVHRRIDFFDQHLTFRSDPAPFVQIAGHVRF